MLIRSAREVMVPLFLCGICAEDGDLLHEGLHSGALPADDGKLPVFTSSLQAARTSDV